MKTLGNMVFRENILRALKETTDDKELKEKLHKLLEAEVDKELPYLVRPVVLDKKVLH